MQKFLETPVLTFLPHSWTKLHLKSKSVCNFHLWAVRKVCLEVLLLVMFIPLLFYSFNSSFQPFNFPFVFLFISSFFNRFHRFNRFNSRLQARSFLSSRSSNLTPRVRKTIQIQYIAVIVLTKYPQRHKGSKVLRTLTHSTPLVQSRSFNKFSILGQIWAWVLVGKGQEIHRTTLTNPSNNFDKSE